MATFSTSGKFRRLIHQLCAKCSVQMHFVLSWLSVRRATRTIPAGWVSAFVFMCLLFILSYFVFFFAGMSPNWEGVPRK